MKFCLFFLFYGYFIRSSFGLLSTPSIEIIATSHFSLIERIEEPLDEKKNGSNNEKNTDSKHALSQIVPMRQTNETRQVKIVSKSWIGAGFFAELKKVIYNLIYHCDYKMPKTLVVDWSQEFFPYKDDPQCNGWDLYFEPIHSDMVYTHRFTKSPPEPKHDDPDCIQRWICYKDYLPYRKFIHEKFKKYITIKQDILKESDQFYDEHMKNHFCIGIHVRFAAAHTSENLHRKPIALADFIQEAKNQLELHRYQNPILFIATDSRYVIDTFKEHFHPTQLAFTNAFRAQYNEEPHLIYERKKYYMNHPEEFHKHKPGFFGGRMVLVDCLLLSKCELMIHSLSNVSDFAVWFNPDLESIFLPKGLSSHPCHCENLFSFFKDKNS